MQTNNYSTTNRQTGWHMFHSGINQYHRPKDCLLHNAPTPGHRRTERHRCPAGSELAAAKKERIDRISGISAGDCPLHRAPSPTVGRSLWGQSVSSFLPAVSSPSPGCGQLCPGVTWRRRAAERTIYGVYSAVEQSLTCWHASQCLFNLWPDKQ